MLMVSGLDRYYQVGVHTCIQVYTGVHRIEPGPPFFTGGRAHTGARRHTRLAAAAAS